ncbi:AEC family transporter [Anoxybacterium hadale]|uniref:AEC family transporter n=1 Tax=Anoxybacterium hadale TaxID=3408580 RepID=A0ACD1ABK9_9FIRM|nr:AEC family transporter [Clostridiales bacterium]
MNNLLISFNAVAPMFLWMLLGYTTRLKGILDQHSQRQLNRLVFQVFMPALLFYNIYKTDLHISVQPRLMLFVLVEIILMWLLALAVGIKADPRPQKRGALIQGMFRSNFILFGLPVIVSLFGTSGTGVTSMLIAVVIPLYNILSVITLEVFRNCRISVRVILTGILKNPLIIASLVGASFLFFQIQLPQFLESSVSGLANIATSLALVVMGAGFQITLIKENYRNLMLAVLMKLFLIPLIFVSSAIAAGYRGVALAAIMILFSAPTAVSSFPMAAQMESDSDLASEIIAFTTLISCATIFTWIFFLKQWGLI